MAGSNNSAFGFGSMSPPGLGPPSTLVSGAYIISGASTAQSSVAGGSKKRAAIRMSTTKSQRSQPYQ